MNHLSFSLKGSTLLLAMSFAVSSIICQTEEKMRLHKNPIAMKEEILKYIPLGSSIKDAQRIMGANGFKCVLMENASFAEMGKKGVIKRHDNKDFLWCDQEKGAMLFCERRWQVMLVRDDEKVSEVYVSISLTCL